MQYVRDAISLLMAVFIAAQFLSLTAVRRKRAYVEKQLHASISQYLRKGSASEAELFKETKQLLMLDWLDANPERTRVDFAKHFDKLVDGHCESFAIAEYLRRRQMAASNDGSMAATLETTRNLA
jgi:hypothetical protein